uniref:Ras GTPase-activating protein 1 n=1 Tax=Daphnia galeata TaxID=27404 RepID=A0A8J2WFB8_9CRUS|nr:unnamed protein product [Daphnia galeata]
MADFIRGAFGVSRSSSTKEKEPKFDREKEKLHASPSTGSDDNVDLGVEEFDPFASSQAETDDIDGYVALVAPPETEWYHGRLDRFGSESRLRDFGKLGAYLVRESDRKPGSYVLSYFGRTGVNHFRVSAVCGDFYIGGRQFDSLSELVGYYTSCADLLKKERLVHPVAPPEPVNDKKKVVAILPYTRMPDTDELTFHKGDIFFVHNDMGEGWLWVTAHRTGEQGLVFQDLVENIDETIDPNQVFSWFHDNITKEEAVDMLVKAGPGSFLVRPSDNSPGDYSLFFHINNQIQRFRIEKKGVRYLMGGRTFNCLDAVINRYKSEQIVEGHTLGMLVPSSRSVTDGGASSTGLRLEPIRDVSSCAEKIYATLRECREQTGVKKSMNARMQGYLYKKSEKNKKWKSLYFVLQSDNGEDRLYFFDNPKRTKPRGLIDLSCSYLYQVHDSLFDRSYCIQLVERALPCLATVTYLAAPNAESATEWIAALKPLCAPQVARSPKINRLRELRCLHLTVLEAHRLPQRLVPNPYCIIALNQVKVARTRFFNGPDPVWDQEFLLDDIPPDVLTLTLTINNKGKRSKDSEVAELTVEFSNLSNGDEVEEWYNLSGMTPVGEWGTIRLRTRYLHDLIMPEEEYSPLKELLLDPHLEAVRALADLCHLDRVPLATSLLRVFRHERKEADLLQTLNDAEIDKEEETSTLFRAASLTTTLMDHYMKSICTPFLTAAVSETIHKLMEAKQSCELNPSKMDPGGDACANAEFLLQILDEITESILMSAEACPKTIRYICSCLQRKVMSRWPQERLVRTRVVSGFIFLRLLCPAILNPRNFNLIAETPSHNASRSLIMVAKCLQNLANLVEFGGKEPYMEVVNPFILKNKERMVYYLDQLSNIKEKPDSDDAGIRGDPARDLGTLHHICVTHLKDLQLMAKSKLTIKKLVTVTEMLTKHKQKYMEMIR